MHIHVKNLMLAGGVALAAVAFSQKKKNGYNIQGEKGHMTTGNGYFERY